MRKMSFPVCLALFLFLSPVGQAFASSCTVTLKNGNVLTANDCRVDGGRLYLKYPVGEVSILLKDVKAVDGSDAVSGFLQSHGTSTPGAKEKPAEPPRQPDLLRLLEARPRAGAAKAPTGLQQALPRELTVEEEQRSKEVDDFIDRYFSADDRQRDALDNDMDKILDGFMDVKTAGPQDAGSDSTNGENAR